MTYKPFFSFELCKPCGTVMPRVSPTAGLSFAKLWGGACGGINQTQHLPPLRMVIPLQTQPTVVPVLGLSLQITPWRVPLRRAGGAPGAVHTCEPAPAGEASHGRSLPRGRCSPGPSSAATATAAFNFQARPHRLSTHAHAHAPACAVAPHRPTHRLSPPAANGLGGGRATGTKQVAGRPPGPGL